MNTHQQTLVHFMDGPLKGQERWCVGPGYRVAYRNDEGLGDYSYKFEGGPNGLVLAYLETRSTWDFLKQENQALQAELRKSREPCTHPKDSSVARDEAMKMQKPKYGRRWSDGGYEHPCGCVTHDEEAPDRISIFNKYFFSKFCDDADFWRVNSSEAGDCALKEHIKDLSMIPSVDEKYLLEMKSAKLMLDSTYNRPLLMVAEYLGTDVFHGQGNEDTLHIFKVLSSSIEVQPGYGTIEGDRLQPVRLENCEIPLTYGKRYVLWSVNFCLAKVGMELPE